MTGLTPSTRYYYQVGDFSELPDWSDPFFSQPPYLNFMSAAQPTATTRTTLAVVGDAGATDVSDLTYLQIVEMVHMQKINFTLHIGDIR